MGAGWAAYDQDEPLKSPEMKLIADYLDQDTAALERILSWLRNECLNGSLFRSVAEAQIVIESYRQEYNTQRPHQSLDYQTPREFKQAWLDSHLSDTGD